jgi:hypothetical protein
MSPRTHAEHTYVNVFCKCEKLCQHSMSLHQEKILCSHWTACLQTRDFPHTKNCAGASMRSDTSTGKTSTKPMHMRSPSWRPKRSLRAAAGNSIKPLHCRRVSESNLACTHLCQSIFMAQCTAFQPACVQGRFTKLFWDCCKT